MRFMSFVYVDENQGQPPQALYEAMGPYIERSLKSGVLVETGGLAPKAKSKAVQLSGNKISVIDGPFIEAKEMVGGYAVLECGSEEEAVQVAKDFLQLHLDNWPGCEVRCEVRQIEFVTPND
ncbi:MAG TPA: YciI family protein [Chloroflexota bacterium]|nr:YciI family protein [Chloroflexota bacterium]